MKFLQTKPQGKNMDNNYYDFYYTVIKNREGKEIVFDEFEINENDFISFENFPTPNHHVGIKPRETKIRLRN